MVYAGSTAAVLAGFEGLLLVMGLIAIAVYVYMALALITIAKKTKTKNEWLAWIPIANVYLMTQIARVPVWLIIPYVLSFIPIIGSVFALFSIVISVFIWWRIAEARKLPGWIALLMFIPLVNLAIVGVIAWKD